MIRLKDANNELLHPLSTLSYVFLISLILLQVSCSPPKTSKLPDPVETEPPGSTENEIPIPAVEEPFRAVKEGNIKFAFDLYKILSGSVDSNLCFSPYAVSSMMCMAYSGADGETARVIAEKLNFPSPDECNEAFSDLQSKFESRGMIRGEFVEEGIRFDLKHSLWFQSGVEISTAFIEDVKTSYDTQLFNLEPNIPSVDHLAEFARWLGTDDSGLPRIVNLPDTNKFVLSARVDLSGYWRTPLTPWDADGEFHLPDGTKHNLPMMGMFGKVEYARGEAYSIAQLYYSNNLNSIIFIVPDEGFFEEVELLLDEVSATGALGKLKPENLLIDIPILSFRCAINLTDALINMGFPLADDADNPGFRGIRADGRRINTDSIILNTEITIDERSSTTHAAQPVKRIDFADENEGKLMINRPFIFLVRDIPTDTILIMGRVMDPADDSVFLNPHPVVLTPINSDS